jgi:hypothetical protein
MSEQYLEIAVAMLFARAWSNTSAGPASELTVR